MRKRRNHDAGLKVRVALEAMKGACAVSERAAEYGVHPTMIHQWIKPLSAIAPRTMAGALLDGAADIFERGSRKPAEMDAETVRPLYAKIGELAVANDFLSRKLKPWTGKGVRDRAATGSRPIPNGDDRAELSCTVDRALVAPSRAIG